LWPPSRRESSHRVATARAVQAPTGRALRAKQAAAIWPSVAIHWRRRLPPSPDLQPLSQCTPLPPAAAATAAAAQEDKEATTPEGGVEDVAPEVRKMIHRRVPSLDLLPVMTSWPIYAPRRTSPHPYSSLPVKDEQRGRGGEAEEGPVGAPCTV
jgi:hypothetical protein